jgi:type VI secretion system protein ImpA
LVDFDHFAEALAGDSPCGPDCEYDNDFLALSQAVAGKPEQQFGDTVIPAVDPDWREVDSLARALLGRTRDLRIVAWLALANTRLHGVAAFSAGLKLMLSLCERYWDDVHPRAMVDGDSDPYLRMNAIAAFSGSEFSGEDRLVQALRASVLIKQPLTVTYRDVELAFAQVGDAQYSQAQADSMLSDAVAAGNTDIAEIGRAYSSFLALRALLEEKVSSGDTPDLERLESVLKPVARGLERIAAQGADATNGDLNSDGSSSPAGTGGNSQALVSAPGTIQSREDCRRALDRVCDYLERQEPSNPASLFARRAQRLLSMPFLDIMRELSPDSMSHLEMLTGAQQQQDS